jgi:hypothetical protein
VAITIISLVVADYSLGRRRKASGITMPPNPITPEDLLTWNGKSALEWGVTQCTNFWLICLRALNTPPAMEGQVRWFARKDDGERWYTELSRIALELVRADIVGRVGPGKKEIARHH